MADSKATRRISVVTNHLTPVPTRGDSVELCIASSMDDNYHKVHGEVPTHEVVWEKSDFVGDDEEHKEFLDIIYEKALGEGIAKITINRPERRNAFRPQTVKELMRTFNDARDDSSIGPPARFTNRFVFSYFLDICKYGPSLFSRPYS